MWVPIVENNEIGSAGADYVIMINIDNILSKDRELDTIILGCTHYPLLIEVIRKHLPPHIEILEQGRIVSEKLVKYLKKHPELDQRITQNGEILFRTTEYPDVFEQKAALFMGHPVKAENAHL